MARLDGPDETVAGGQKEQPHHRLVPLADIGHALGLQGVYHPDQSGNKAQPIRHPGREPFRQRRLFQTAPDQPVQEQTGKDMGDDIDQAKAERMVSAQQVIDPERQVNHPSCTRPPQGG